MLINISKTDATVERRRRGGGGDDVTHCVKTSKWVVFLAAQWGWKMLNSPSADLGLTVGACHADVRCYLHAEARNSTQTDKHGLIVRLRRLSRVLNLCGLWSRTGPQTECQTRQKTRQMKISATDSADWSGSRSEADKDNLIHNRV